MKIVGSSACEEEHEKKEEEQCGGGGLRRARKNEMAPQSAPEVHMEKPQRQPHRKAAGT